MRCWWPTARATRRSAGSTAFASGAFHIAGFSSQTIDSRIDKEKATAKNVRLFGLFRRRFNKARINKVFAHVRTFFKDISIVIARLRDSIYEDTPAENRHDLDQRM